MYDVILFGGTDEGHKIADFLADRDIKYIVCVATEYGAAVLGKKNVRVGRMDAAEMDAFFREHTPKLVVDATHPYADEVTRNIKAACRCAYVRVARGDTKTTVGDTKTSARGDTKTAVGDTKSQTVGDTKITNGDTKTSARGDTKTVSFGDTKTAAKYLERTEGNILITTGSKEISAFSPLASRAYARVLPSAEAIEKCAEAGFFADRVICMQGPFSQDFNAALMRELNIKYLVTKSSGRAGGFEEKIAAAREAGAECVIIDRPAREDGISVAEAEKLISEMF